MQEQPAEKIKTQKPAVAPKAEPKAKESPAKKPVTQTKPEEAKKETAQPSSPVPVAANKPVEIKKLAEPAKEVEQKTAQSEPILSKEQEDVIKTIEGVTIVKPKVLVAAPDINEKTSSSVQLEEETQQASAAPVAVNDKQFAEEPAQIQKISAQELDRKSVV